MGVIVENGTFKIEVIKEIAEDIANSLELGGQLSAKEAEELAQKAHQYFSRKWDEFHELICNIKSLDQSSYGADVGHPGMNEVFSTLLHTAISKEELLKEIQSVFK